MPPSGHFGPIHYRRKVGNAGGGCTQLAVTALAHLYVQRRQSKTPDPANYGVGDRVIATWDPAIASPLKTSSSVTVPSPERAA